MSVQYGIFNSESVDYTEAEAVEAGFWTEAEAIDALVDFGDDDDLHVHEVEEADDDSECDEEDC